MKKALKIFSILTISIVVIVGPFFILKYYRLLGISNSSTSGTGQIGDTIGGLYSPFIGLLSAVLIYISFKEQVKANRLLQVQINEESFRVNLKDSLSKIDSFGTQFSNRKMFELIDAISYNIEAVSKRYTIDEKFTDEERRKNDALNGSADVFMRNQMLFCSNELAKPNVLYGYIYHHYDYLLKNAQRAQEDQNYILLDFIILSVEEFNSFVHDNFPMFDIIPRTLKHASKIHIGAPIVSKFSIRFRQIELIRIKLNSFMSRASISGVIER